MSEGQPDLTVDEIIEKYNGLWVAVKITRRDRTGQPVRGKVLHYHAIRKQVADTIYGKKGICLFRAIHVPEEGYVAMF
ncbi:MAG: hypothetical protein HYU39_00445 [Thaumarchaeota archaeon]|nr:hypothetical protein [Nitrososphaerota archaeon]